MQKKTKKRRENPQKKHEIEIHQRTMMVFGYAVTCKSIINDGKVTEIKTVTQQIFKLNK